MEVVPGNLKLSAQRALLGAIHPEVRLVKVKFDGRAILFTALIESESDIARMALSTAAAEIVSDFPDYDLNEIIKVDTDNLPREDILKEGWVYQRAED